MLGNAAAAAAAAESSEEEDVPNESGEFASEAVSAGGSPTTPRSLLCRLLVVVAQSAQGQWECVQPSLVEVGFRLLASRDHSASDACNGGGANLPEICLAALERGEPATQVLAAWPRDDPIPVPACGALMLVSAFQVHPALRESIVERLNSGHGIALLNTSKQPVHRAEHHDAIFT